LIVSCRFAQELTPNCIWVGWLTTNDCVCIITCPLIFDPNSDFKNVEIVSVLDNY